MAQCVHAVLFDFSLCEAHSGTTVFTSSEWPNQATVFFLSEVKQDSHKNNTAKNFLALLDITELLEMVFCGITLDYFTNNI